MMCAWKEFLSVLPQWIRQDVDRLGKNELQELRLRINAPPELVLEKGSRWISAKVGEQDLAFVVNAASRYSPWAAETAASGYVTAPGGHRIGMCGEAVCHHRTVTGIRKLDSLCIRVARDYPGISDGLPRDGSVLILGAPGWGKTTLLRDLARAIAEYETVAVVDERGELFPAGYTRGKRMDVLTGAPKTEGIDALLRTMGPAFIAVDEITAKSDCEALMRVHGCGVKLLASAHASSGADLRSREIYRTLVDQGVFDHIVILNRDKRWRLEGRKL